MCAKGKCSVFYQCINIPVLKKGASHLISIMVYLTWKSTQGFLKGGGTNPKHTPKSPATENCLGAEHKK